MAKVAVLASLVIIVSTILAGSNALDDFAKEVESFTFVYHDFDKLLLTIHADQCYYTLVDDSNLTLLSTTQGRQQIEQEIMDAVTHGNRIKATTLNEMLNLYGDRLADYHCLDKRIFTLQLGVIGPDDGIFDCSDAKKLDRHDDSGVHHLHYIAQHGRQNFTAYCDQTTDGGGWTVLVNRMDGSANFQQNYHEYRFGFGTKSGEYWLGLQHAHIMTNGSRRYMLRVEMSDFDGSTAYAVYDVFKVDGPEMHYVLHVSGYHGTAGDSLDRTREHLHSANGMEFSTFDKDRDNSPNNCAADRHFGWWHNNCFDASPTGIYHSDGVQRSDEGMAWHSWHNSFRPLKTMAMKIRPVV